MFKFYHFPLFLFSLLVFCFSTLYAQEQSGLGRVVNGRVVNGREASLPLASVTIYNLQDKFVASTNTDSDGHFSFKIDSLEGFFVWVKHVGYYDYKSDIFDSTKYDLKLLNYRH